jgi:hypothetical protein
MPYTYREYPVWELGISTYTNPTDSTSVFRIQACDIIEARYPHGGIGAPGYIQTKMGLEDGRIVDGPIDPLSQGTGVIWIHVYGWDRAWFEKLNTPFWSTALPDISDPIYSGDAVPYDKRRYCVPFERLKRVIPGFSVEMAIDFTQTYQPWAVVDMGNADNPYDAGRFLAQGAPIYIDGLVYDKLTRRYIYG